jgi:hypothetical protein
MTVRVDDLVELRAGDIPKEGQIAIVLEIYATPSLGYLVEDIDIYAEDRADDQPDVYAVEPEEIKRVLDGKERKLALDASYAQALKYAASFDS